VFRGPPRGPCIGSIYTHPSRVGDIEALFSPTVGDGPEDPRLHDAIHLRPIWMGSGDRSVGEDVLTEGELADDKKELIPPASVVAGDVKDRGDQSLDGIVKQQGVATILWGGVVGGEGGRGALALSAR